MNYDNFTSIAQKALKSGSSIAKEKNHKSIENGHLMLGILTVDKNVAPFLLKKLSIDVIEFEEKIKRITESYQSIENNKLAVSSFVEKTLNKALAYSRELADDYISIEHLLLGILVSGDTVSTLMRNNGINEINLKKSVTELRKGFQPERLYTSNLDALNRYATNLNDKVKAGKIDPVIGRDDEIRRMLQIISRRTKNNPIVLGEPGVGKTALVEGLAIRIERADVPDNLRGVQIFSLDLAALIAGASRQGEFEERLKQVIKEVQTSNGEIILFIDEIHVLVGAGKASGSMDAANILKPALARSDLKIIGATTFEEYQKYIERDRALERRFQKLIIDEPSPEIAVSILRGLKENYQAFHRIKIKDEAILAAVDLSRRYITDRFLPDKAVDLIDEAASKLRLDMNSLPEEIDILERMIRQISIEKEAIRLEGDEQKVNELVEKIAGLSDERNRLRAIWETEKEIYTTIAKLKAEVETTKVEAEKAELAGEFEKAAKLKFEKTRELKNQIEKLNTELKAKQEDTTLFKEELDKESIAEIVSEITGIPLQKMLQSEKDKLLKLEEELGKRVIGQKQAVIAVADAVRRSRAGLGDENKPIGSFIFLGTTGVGKTELAKALAEFLFDDEKAMIRIDMSEYQEKHAVARMIGSPPGYVGFEEGGQLTEQVRRKPFSVVLFDEVEKAHSDIFNTLLQVLDDGRLTDTKGRVVNFKNTIIIMTSNAGSDKILENYENMTPSNKEQVLVKTKQDVSKALREKMSPEFLNRIDEIIMFSPLTYSEIKQIATIQLDKLDTKLERNDIKINFTSGARAWTAKMGYNPQFGARPVKRVIQRYIINEISKLILKSEVDKAKIINVDYADGKLTFKNISAEELDALQNLPAQIDEKVEIPKEEKEKLDEQSKPADTTINPAATVPPVEEKMGFWKRIWMILFGKNKV